MGLEFNRAGLAATPTPAEDFDALQGVLNGTVPDSALLEAQNGISSRAAAARALAGKVDPAVAGPLLAQLTAPPTKDFDVGTPGSNLRSSLPPESFRQPSRQEPVAGTSIAVYGPSVRLAATADGREALAFAARAAKQLQDTGLANVSLVVDARGGIYVVDKSGLDAEGRGTLKVYGQVVTDAATGKPAIARTDDSRFRDPQSGTRGL